MFTYTCNRLKLLALSATTCLTIFGGSAHADALGSVESYGHWVDVTNQSSVGDWTKVDSPSPVTSQGELVAAPQHGTAVPRTGLTLLDLRTESIYVSGGDGADYNYAINNDDFGGVDPALHTSGTVDLEFWVCPNTWSGDAGFFTPAGIYQTTSVLNSNGDVLASIGMNSLGNSNSPEVHYSIDGVNWTSTGLTANSSTWTQVSLAMDLDAMTTSISYTDDTATTVNSGTLAWSGGITATDVTTLNLQMVDGVTKNYFDDFSFTAAAASVPEPSSVVVMAIGFLPFCIRRRRKRSFVV